jgi:hypothetical protein
MERVLDVYRRPYNVDIPVVCMDETPRQLIRDAHTDSVLPRIGAFWNRDPEQNQLLLAVSRRRRAWFEGLWANAGYPPVLPVQVKSANGLSGINPGGIPARMHEESVLPPR